MTFNRRAFLGASAITGLGALAAGNGSRLYRNLFGDDSTNEICRQLAEAPLLESVKQVSFRQPAFSITPVVSDGKWIWRDPPTGETGYLEPRDFEVTVGIELKGRGAATDIKASTVAPVSHPEQELIDVSIDTKGCLAKVSECGESAAQLLLAADQIEKGQTLSATARFKMRIMKDYRDFDIERFPKKQTKATDFGKQYLRNSPGIRSSATSVKDIVRNVSDTAKHPWEMAHAFYDWVWENIEGVPGDYTSVEAAIKNRRGDCEERACVFIALCRAAGIPARQVWVPSHVWAEIGLHDFDGNLHWIPIHTASYNWFGWTGVHEIILQKGDKLRLAKRKGEFRLIDDWLQCRGKRPESRYSLNIRPVASDGVDAGPGAREKLANGQWKLVGTHPAQRYLRDG